MACLGAADRARVEELSRELATIQLDAPGQLDALLPRLRAFLELDCLVLFCPVERVVGWGIERLESDNLPNASRFAATLARFLEGAPRRFWFFDPVVPEVEQRDRVIETAALVGEATYRSAPVSREVLCPLHLDSRRELRVLVCDGPALLAWVGGFHEGPIAPVQRDRFAALVPALRRRLVADRALRVREVTLAAVAAALDHIDDAAFVVGPRGELAFVNHAARMRLQLDREATAATLSSSDARHTGERVPLRCGDAPPHALFVLRRLPDAERGDPRVRQAAERWRLTRRQREVLQLILRGRGNAAIAEDLGITERAVEFHVTAILTRACVSNRASLIALVLGALVLG